ncbi:MAG: FAD-dependent oxidoreductase [Nanoarchaeota archaeon]|nr:FAD-dependent oxidoreductase [Nanoarchaeota archaeon]
MTHVVILGLGAAGFGAALAAKKHDRNTEITILDNKDFDLMHQCGLPFALEGKIESVDSLKHAINAERMDMKLVSKADIKKVDFNLKEVHYNGEKISYDKLVIATGSSPFIPQIKTDSKIFTVHNIDDVKELANKIKIERRAIVVGAGAVGLETAVALKKKGLEVKVIDMLDSTFPKAIDEDMSFIIEEKLKEKGIELELGKKISEINEQAIVIMATGVKPNIDFLKSIKLKVNDCGIEVNDKMETSIKDVYAVGDCCCVSSLINKKKMPSQLANNAYKEGTVAGVNAAGGKKKYSGILNTFVSVVDDLEIAATGFNSFFTNAYGIRTAVSKVRGKSRPEWYGEAEELTVKLIATEKGKLIGAQAIGRGAKERINIVSTAIKAGFTLEDLSNIELAYCPSVSDYYDVLIMAADLALRKLNSK